MGLDSMTDSQMYDYQSSELSHDQEKEIARAFMGRIEWEMIVIGLGQFLIWLGFWAMVLMGSLSLWAGFFLSTISTAF